MPLTRDLAREVRDAEPCMCGAEDCLACRGPAAECAGCEHEDDCDLDPRACAAERAEDRAAMAREAREEEEW